MWLEKGWKTSENAPWGRGDTAKQWCSGEKPWLQNLQVLSSSTGIKIKHEKDDGITWNINLFLCLLKVTEEWHLLLLAT